MLLLAGIDSHTSGQLLSVGSVYAHHLQEYVKNSKHPFLPLSRVSQGQHFELFDASFDDRVPVRPLK